MLHLSLLHLRRGDDRWRNLDLYQAHQFVWKAFPEVPRGERPFLFSLDRRGRHHSLLVQSIHAPDWAFLDSSATVQTKSFDPLHFEVGQTLRFFVRCNPTVARRTPQGRGVRQPVGLGQGEELHDEMPNREAQLRQWLQKQGHRGGFEVDAEACQVGPSVRRVIMRANTQRRAERPIVLHEVEISGRLIVTDAHDFAATLAQGIGRGRSFGCGLLMLKPV